MIEHAVEVRIERPVDEVFAFVTFKKASDANFRPMKQLLERRADGRRQRRARNAETVPHLAPAAADCR